MDLVVVEQFLNTLDERAFSWHGERHTGNDELTSVQALSAWLEAHDLVGAGQELRASDLAAALPRTPRRSTGRAHGRRQRGDRSGPRPFP